MTAVLLGTVTTRTASILVCIKHEYVRFEVFTAVTMKNAVFLDVAPCGSYNN
jgi:hypothetical protein